MRRTLAVAWLAASLAGCADLEPPTSQTGAAFESAVPSCAGVGGAQALLDIAADAPRRDSGAYDALDAPGRAALASSVLSAVARDAQGALSGATQAGYTLCATRGVALWLPDERTAGRARFAIRFKNARPLIVEAPHPLYDSDTLEEAVEVFAGTGARAVLIAGTHRCANPVLSGCDGTTSACAPDEPYRESDAAHNDLTAFEAVHEALADAFEDDWVVSLHGMGGSGVSVSDGTTAPAAADSAVARVGTALQAAFPGENITSCNPYPGAVVDARLCGTTNVQGRYVNGSADTCTQAAGSASGRFVHMEQSSAIRGRIPEVVAALGSALP